MLFLINKIKFFFHIEKQIEIRIKCTYVYSLIFKAQKIGNFSVD